MLCELARTDHHRFRVLEPDCDQTKALRALTRAREDLVGTRTALTNQLRAELATFWPGPLGLFTSLHSRISLAFLERYPSPQDAHGLGPARLQALRARQRYTGRQKPAQLLAKLRRAPVARVGELELAARRALILSMVSTIKTLNEQIRQLERQIATGIREHPDGAIFLSLFKQPGSVICAAELLAEIGDCRARYPTRDTLAADAGQAAVATSQANARPPASAGPATSVCARRSSRSRTPAATTTPGRRISTPPPAPAGTTTPARSAPSAEAGAESYGAAGRTAPHMTRPAIAPCNATSLSPSPPCRAPCPTQPPPSGWPAPLSPEGRPERAERNALDGKPTSAIPFGHLTQDVHALSRLAARGGRLHRPDDAQAEPREVDVGRRAIASVGLLTAGSPRTQPSCLGRADDCVARMMRKSNHARSPSDAALFLL